MYALDCIDVHVAVTEMAWSSAQCAVLIKAISPTLLPLPTCTCFCHVYHVHGTAYSNLAHVLCTAADGTPRGGAHKLCECHVTLPSPAPKKARNKLVLACLIALVFMTAEVIGKGMCAVCHVWSVPCVLCACYAGTWRITACTTFCHTLHKTRPQVWCVHVWCGVVGLVCYCVHT